MNTTTNTKPMPATFAAKATNVVDGSPLTARDVRDLNKVAALVTKFGAVSVERAMKITKLSERSVRWCFFMTGCYAPSTDGMFIFECVGIEG